jgi:hypothetical protein
VFCQRAQQPHSRPLRPAAAPGASHSAPPPATQQAQGQDLFLLCDRLIFALTTPIRDNDKYFECDLLYFCYCRSRVKMSNRYHNEFHHNSDSHFGSQFSVGSSYVESQQDQGPFGSNFDLDHRYEGHFVPPNDSWVYQEGLNDGQREETKYCSCTIL